VDEIEEYIQVNQVDVIFKAILVKCFRERSANPIELIIDYLFANYPDQIPARLKDLGSADANGEEEVVVKVSHKDPEKEEYLNQTLDISSLFSHVASAVADAQPEDPVGFILNTMKALKEDGVCDDDVEGGGDSGEDLLEDFKKRTTITGRRASVSAECNGKTDSPLTTPKREAIKKSPEERVEILDAIGNNILFKDLDDDLKETVVGAVFPVEHAAGAVIIAQGDEGDNWYVIREGEAMASQKMPAEVSKDLVSYAAKDSFGELALMYGYKRAATVQANTDVKLWALDGATFRAVVVQGTATRRTQYEDFLKKVPILMNLTDHQRKQVADVMDTVKYEKDEALITQGDAAGQQFYILEHGTAVAEFETPQGIVQTIRTYSSGEHFGELSFLIDAPRAVTIRATSKVTCVTLDKSSFKRLLGPCEKVLVGHIQEYGAAIAKFVVTSGLAS